MQAILANTNDQLEKLTRINLQDMLDNFGLSRLQRGRQLIEQVFRSPAQKFARQVIAFDRRVGETGLQSASEELLFRYANRLDVIGAEYVPSSGPVVFASNHPGMVDTLACFSSIPRADLRAVAADRTFTHSLPNIDRHLIYVPNEPAERLTAVRQVARHLQGGGAVLICPAGRIEPDPACMPGAVDALADWSDSLGLFVRRAPDTAIVPVVVSGVIQASTLRSPLIRFRRNQKDRERVAATLQLLQHTLRPSARPLNVRIEFGPALPGRELIELGSAAAATKAITASVRQIIDRCAVDWSVASVDAQALPDALRADRLHRADRNPVAAHGGAHSDRLPG